LSYLDEVEREEQRYELFKLVGELATQRGHPQAGSYAIAFVLWDVLGQLVEVNKNLKETRAAIEQVSLSIDIKS